VTGSGGSYATVSQVGYAKGFRAHCWSRIERRASGGRGSAAQLFRESAPLTRGEQVKTVRVSRVMATDLDTERGGTDANKRDGARQAGRLNVAGLQL
jgi:hypothetical protein